MRSASPRRSFSTRSGSAICARVISTPAHRPPSSATIHSASTASTIDPCATTGTAVARGDGAGEVAVARRRLVVVGTRLFDRVDRPAGHDEVVDSGCGELGGEVEGRLGRDAGPRSQLVARQAQPEHAAGPDRRPHGGEHLEGERACRRTPPVVAVVGEPGEELAHEAVLAGVHLDAVASGLDGEAGAAREPGDDRGDVVVLHPLRHLAGRHLGHPRRRPQLALAVRRRSLPTGVVERGDGERSVLVQRRGDRPPSVAAPLGQRCPLVGPVRRVHRRPLDHHRAAPAGGAPPVVGDVPGGELAVVVAEVGDVRAEHDPVRRLAGAEGERVEQPHGAVPSGVGGVSECSSRRSSRRMLAACRQHQAARTRRRWQRSPTPASRR